MPCINPKAASRLVSCVPIQTTRIRRPPSSPETHHHQRRQNYRRLSSNITAHFRPAQKPTMPGFDFSNYNRNSALHARGVQLPKATSTGTTIVGCIFDGGVVVSISVRLH